MDRIDYYTVGLLALGTLLILVDMLSEGHPSMRGCGAFMGFTLYMGGLIINAVGRP